MPLTKIDLAKFLRLSYADKSDRVKILRSDIRQEIRKANGGNTDSGGSFYPSFWADAKHHVSGNLDLRQATGIRIEKNERRKRLYPLLEKGFLLWWEQKRRFRNEEFNIVDQNVRGSTQIGSFGAIKIDNLLTLKVGDDGYRVIYPYFFETPSISDEAARLGLWAMNQCIKQYSLSDMRILDVIRGQAFSTIETNLEGNEEQKIATFYSRLLNEWNVIKASF